MTCFLPAPPLYVSVMHNLHFLSTPTYIITLFALFQEASPVFQRYKYYLIVHIIVNFLSEVYVTFMWLPITHLPYDVHKSTGWLAEWDVSGMTQFMVLAQFIILIGISIFEMFYHRFNAVVIQETNSFMMKIIKLSIYIFRVLSVIHLVSIVWIMIDGRSLIYQQNKKDELFRKHPDLPKDVGCYTVFILAPEDPQLIFNVVIWGILATIATTAIISTVVFIDRFLRKARYLSKETKKLQRMLVLSLLVQAAIHSIMIVFPIGVQIYQMAFVMYDNNFALILFVCLAYHGFMSTCAMILFTKQIRLKIMSYWKIWVVPKKPILIRPQTIGESVFRYLLVHIIINFLSEAYVTFLWLPITHLPYDVHKSTGWLAEWGVSGMTQFMVLAQFVVFVAISIFEMFYHRFKVVVIDEKSSFMIKIIELSIYIYRILSAVHLISVLWGIIGGGSLIYQQNKKDELFRTHPELPSDIFCYTVFILAFEDPQLIFNVVIWCILVTIAPASITSIVVFIEQFLQKASYMSKETKKLQRMLVLSLSAQAVIHATMIFLPVGVQIYHIAFVLHDDNFVTTIYVCLAYHGFISTFAIILFTKQIRLKIMGYWKIWVVPKKPILIRPHTFGETVFR